MGLRLCSQHLRPKQAHESFCNPVDRAPLTDPLHTAREDCVKSRMQGEAAKERHLRRRSEQIVGAFGPFKLLSY